MSRRTSAESLAGRRVVFVVAGGLLGGAERNALELALHFERSEGAAVGFCALDERDGRTRREAIAAGLAWTCTGTSWPGGKTRTAGALARFASGLRRLRPDVVVASTNLPNVVCGLTWRMTGAKLFVWNQGDVLGTTRIGRTWFRRALHAAPVVVTPAFHARAWLVDRYGARADRIHVVRSAVTLPEARESRPAWRRRLELDDDDFVACMLAHLHRGKDHDTLLRAWRIVLDRLDADGCRAVLLLAGRPAGGEDSVKALAYDLDLRDTVRFLGDVDDVSGMLGACDLAVFTSHSEGLGRGATEPMYAGLPLVGTDIPGISEAVGDAGRKFLAPPGRAAALAERILRFAADPDLRAQTGRANAQLIRSRQSRAETTEVYADLIARNLGG